MAATTMKARRLANVALPDTWPTSLGSWEGAQEKKNQWCQAPGSTNCLFVSVVGCYYVNAKEGLVLSITL